MSVRAKFFVQKVTRQAGNVGGEVVLSAATRGAGNADWASATPSGTITMQVNNPAAFAQFEKAITNEWPPPEVYVDFEFLTPAMPEDGHPYVASPEGHYNAPNCSECARPKEEHAA